MVIIKCVSLFTEKELDLTCTQHFPFDLPTQKTKAVFGLKLFLFMGSAFSIPFIASAYQLFVSFVVEKLLEC